MPTPQLNRDGRDLLIVSVHVPKNHGEGPVRVPFPPFEDRCNVLASREALIRAVTGGIGP